MTKALDSKAHPRLILQGPSKVDLIKSRSSESTAMPSMGWGCCVEDGVRCQRHWCI